MPPPNGSKHELFDDFERLANCSQDAIYHYDLDSKEFHFINRKFKTYFDIEDKANIATVSDQAVLAIHAEDREQALSAINASLKNGDTEGEVEYRVQYPDGGIRFLHDRWIVLRNSNCDPIAIQGFIRDNTQNYLSENQFIESKHNALIGNYIVQKGKFTCVNQQFLSITGYNQNELIGRDPMTLVQEDYREHVSQCAATMLKGENYTPYEFCVFDKSGATHWVMETVTSVTRSRLKNRIFVQFRGGASVLKRRHT